jgi:hypothetical protein
MIYFLVTTSIFNNCNIRKKQYKNCISKLKKTINKLNITNYKIIIIENNGLRKTYLDLLISLNCEVFYTNNNILLTDKGYKELQDILDCIEFYNIKDTDFIVKITGRYFLDYNSEFMMIIKEIDTTNYDCVIKYGSYNNPVDCKMHDCITGLIGMRAIYIKQINKPTIKECVEWKWAEATYLMNDEKIYQCKKLGINICPGSNIYFSV